MCVCIVFKSESGLMRPPSQNAKEAQHSLAGAKNINNLAGNVNVSALGMCVCAHILANQCGGHF